MRGSRQPVTRQETKRCVLAKLDWMSISLHPDSLEGRAPAATAAAADPFAEVKPAGTKIRIRLFTKYVALFVAVVAIALLSNGIFEVFFYYREHKAALIRIQHEQAEAAAAKIGQFIKEIESQLGWTTQLPWSAGSIEQRRFDALRLLRQVPAITELAQVDSTGKERLRVSRLAMDLLDSGIDLSKDPKFTEAVAHKVYYGPVYFRRESEPYMTLSLAGTRKDAGVSVAEVNLKLIWDVVSQIKVGERGHAYVVGADGRLIAHPDISLVLRNTDMSKLIQVRAAQSGNANTGPDALQGALNIQGQEVLTASAPIPPLGWTMLVELPVEEAYASLYAALQRLAVVLLGASIFAVLAGIFLARRMVGPIQALRAGAERIGGGDFAQRISIKTGDELEGLADQFNDMGARLQESYADLEKKVELRTIELSESLQQQTATADVLKVISRSAFDLKSVLTTLTESAKSLCGASLGIICLRDGEVMRLQAETGCTQAFVDFMQANPIRPGRETITGRVFRDGKPVHVADVQLDPEYNFGQAPTIGAYRAVLAVPLMRDAAVEGVLLLGRPEPGPFSHRQIDLVQTFADQAVIAIENVRLFDEVQAQTRNLTESLQQQTATADVLRAISRAGFDLDTVLLTLVSTAARLCNAGPAQIFRRDGDVYRYAASQILEPGYRELEEQAEIRAGRGTVVGRAALEKRAVQILDAWIDPEYEAKDDAKVGNVRTMLAVPLLRDGEPVGAFALARNHVEAFSDTQIKLVSTFADQAVIAIENARLFAEVQERTKELSESLDELRAAQDRLVQTEKLASLGQLTAGIAHEIKNPLNFVNNFSALSAELIDELNEALKPVALDGKLREEIDELTQMLKGNLEKVVQHGKRADSIVKNMLLHSREGSGEHRPVDINAIVEESLNLAYHGARAEKSGFNITLQRDLDPAAGMIDLYAQEMTRVFLNLISNGFYAATKRKESGDESFEPTLSATTKSLGNKVEIRIRDNGSGIPLDVKEKMFNPFFTTKPAGEGTGLGLSMSHDIVVKQHGGKIDVDTMPGAFTEFIITLPRTAAAQPRAGGAN
jgi:signal transduction histidine kinase